MKLRHLVSVTFLATTLFGGALSVPSVPDAHAADSLRARQAMIATSAEKAKPSPPPLTNPADLNPGTRLLSVGTLAPNFSLATTSGQQYTLSALRGHPVVLEFIAIWCPHCQREAPIVNRLVLQYGPLGVHVLDILANPYGKNYDTSGGTDTHLATKNDLAWYIMTYHVNRPVLIDPHFRTVNRYGIYSYPTLYVLGAHGIIRHAFVGDTSYAALSAAVGAVSRH